MLRGHNESLWRRTVIKIRLTRAKITFETDAKVIFSHVSMGMGVAFVSTAEQQAQTLQKWLSELAGNALVEQEPPRQPEGDTVLPTSALVLGELVIALMRKGTLSDAEGKAMLQKLYR